ncbi:MAG TPA: phosphomannomutase/phosphoglucomutase [Gemmatimonadota bacterium]|nr:phosphomannomutase/phosphoglucomutase [Gemmatimonadota bacterium]
MQVPAHIFREYDIRGLVDDEVTPELVRAIGRGFATLVARRLGKEGPRLAVGRDVRPSSDAYRDAMVEGLRESGARVLDIGVVPTPVLYYACHRLDTDGGVMITASHNPSEYNGFKLNWRQLPLSGDEIQAVRGLIEAGDFVDGAGTLEDAPVTDDYLEMVTGKIELERAVSVVLDCGNATGALFTPELLERVGASVDPLFCTVDGTFPNHHPDPTVDENIVALKERLRGGSGELGIGLDGDCDRIGAVDENGRTVRGDQLTAIFARYQLDRTPGERIVFDVKSSRALEEDIRKHGGVPLMWKTGHSLIKKKMVEDGLVFGGEMSGHLFFFHDYWGFDDAIFAACRLCEIVSRSDRTLGEMVDSLNHYPSTPEVRVETTEEAKWALVEAARRHFGERYDTLDIDGVRVTFPHGWALLRASNTQPVVVLRAEGESESALDSIKAELEGLLTAQGIDGIPWEG